MTFKQKALRKKKKKKTKFVQDPQCKKFIQYVAGDLTDLCLSGGIVAMHFWLIFYARSSNHIDSKN